MGLGPGGVGQANQKRVFELLAIGKSVTLAFRDVSHHDTYARPGPIDVWV